MALLLLILPPLSAVSVLLLLLGTAVTTHTGIHGPGNYYYITSTTGAPEKVGLVSAQAPQVKVKVKGILRSFEGSERKVAFEGGAWGSDWGSPKTDNI